MLLVKFFENYLNFFILFVKLLLFRLNEVMQDDKHLTFLKISNKIHKLCLDGQNATKSCSSHHNSQHNTNFGDILQKIFLYNLDNMI